MTPSGLAVHMVAPPMNRIRVLIRAKDTLLSESVISLLGRGFVFLSRYFFQYGNYVLYEHTTQERNEDGFLPKIQDFTFEIVTTNEQAEALMARGYDFLSFWIRAHGRLEKGGVAFCVFVEHKLISIGWVALTEEAKKLVDPLPYHVDFSKEACLGGARTLPEYRGRGLMLYGDYRRYKFLRESGIMRAWSTVNANNIASQRVMAKLGPMKYAKAHYLKILCWQFWRETPVVPTNNPD